MNIELINQHSRIPVDGRRLVEAAAMILESEGARRGHVNVVLVDDAQIQALNRRHLQHDWPTDTLSFLLERDAERLEGEVIVSVEMAGRQAPRYGWQAADELLLYVIHAVLHLVGYDDADPAARSAMRSRERHYLGRFGLTPRYDEPPAAGAAEPSPPEGGPGQ